MSPWAVLATVFAVHVVAMASPGPNVLLVTQMAASRSRRQALAAAGGIATAALVLASAGAFGLGVLVAQVEPVHLALRVLGGGYLVLLGVRMWRHADELVAAPATALSDRACFRAGVLTNVTNPKAAVFFGSVFAAVLPAEAAPGLRAAAVALVAVDALAWHSLLAVVFATPPVQGAYRRAKRRLDRVLGAVLGAVGLRLALG